MSNRDEYRDEHRDKKADDVAVSSSEDDDEDDDDDDDDDDEDEDGTDDPDQVEETSSITSSFDASPSSSRVRRAATLTDSGSPVHRQASTENRKKWCWPPPSSPSRSSSLPTSPRHPPWAPLLRSQYMAAAAAAANQAQTSHDGNAGAGAGPGAAQSADRHAKVFGHRLRLYCRTGYHLAIRPHGEVTGSSDPNDKYAVLELSSVKTGEVRIRGVASNRFLAMNRKGRLHGQIHKKENTVFVESMLGSYNTYLSRKYAHLGWYVAIRKNGRKKPAQKTRYGQKAIQFLPVRLTTA